MNKNATPDQPSRPRSPSSDGDHARQLKKFWNDQLDRFEDSFRPKKATEDSKS